MTNLDPPFLFTPLHIFRNIWTPGPYISEIYEPQLKNVDPHTSSQEFLSKCSDVDNNLLLSCTMNNGSIYMYIRNMAQSRFKLASSPGSLFF